MKNHLVRISPFAQQDLSDSFEWGIRNWGIEKADKWLDEIEQKVFSRLGQMPKAFPIAPESQEFDIEIRHFVIGRYRILFTISGSEVLVLRVRGPFRSST